MSGREAVLRADVVRARDRREGTVRVHTDDLDEALDALDSLRDDAAALRRELDALRQTHTGDLARERERVEAAERECERRGAELARVRAAVRMHESAREQMDAHDRATLRSLAGDSRAVLIEELAGARRERDDWNARATALESERDAALADAALDVAAVAAEALALLAPMRDRRECGSCGMVDPPTEEGGQFHIACPKAHPTMGTYAVETMHSLPTRDTLEPFCHAVIALAARVTAAEAQRAALAGAVREERALAAEYDAAWAAHIAGGAPLDAAEGVLAMCDRLDGVRAATDALLRGAPGGYVRASVVRRYMHAAENSVDAGEMIEARGALVDALAAAGSACRSDDDGDCRWNRCPQRLDGEPWVTGRVCPLTKET